MKTLRIISIIVVTALVCVYVGYSYGRHREQRITVGMIEGSFVADFTALESLRGGDTPAAIQRLEKHAFMSANVLLSDPAANPLRVMDTFRPQFVAYRQAHRANPAEWTPTEKQLEQRLAQTK